MDQLHAYSTFISGTLPAALVSPPSQGGAMDMKELRLQSTAMSGTLPERYGSYTTRSTEHSTRPHSGSPALLCHAVPC